MKKVLLLLLLGCLPFLQMASMAVRLMQASLKQHAAYNKPARTIQKTPELHLDLLHYFIP